MPAKLMKTASYGAVFFIARQVAGLTLKAITGPCLAVILAVSSLLTVPLAAAQGPLPRFEPVAEGEDFPALSAGLSGGGPANR